MKSVRTSVRQAATCSDTCSGGPCAPRLAGQVAARTPVPSWEDQGTLRRPQVHHGGDCHSSDEQQEGERMMTRGEDCEHDDRRRR